MLRVVFDSNVYISALLFDGPPRQILEFAVKRQVVLIASDAIIAETAGKLADKFSWPEHRIEQFVRATGRLAELHKAEEKIAVVHDDADNRVLECAVAGDADLIISGDKHLLGLKSYQNIPIQKPKYLTYLFEKEE
ncbi:MAG: putative toxin-antitoxin system toxin component, PIN family [Actinobacteria bacterium]|nr:putative toxin-antitoxin system toxin component, PIN family [Actinomycetota bacterium]MBU1943988.1 putative toxin-antitoxin system toxin component, PIN family [Actinomycetota bacterium]MBU2688484.1 putative toxin-antitoxin system toxin component, PIN family [Actinomycetota bacterium]